MTAPAPASTAAAPAPSSAAAARPGPAIALLAALGLAVVAQLYLPLPLLGDLAAAAGVGPAAAGLVASLFGFAYAAGFLVFGPLSDRVGRRPVMAGGLAALALASLAVAGVAAGLPATAADAAGGSGGSGAGSGPAAVWPLLLGLRIVQGLAAAALPPVSLAWLGEALPPDRRAFGIACMASAFLAAGILGQIWGAAAGSLTAAIGPLAAVYAVGAVALLRLPETRPRAADGADGAAGADGAGRAGLLAPWAAMPDVLTRRSLAPAYGAALVLLMSFVAFYAAMTGARGPMLAEAGWDPTGVRLAALPAMLLPLAVSRAIPRFGPPRIVQAGLVLAALGLAAAGLAPGAWMLVAASVVFVAGVAVTVPSLIALVGAAAPDRRGLATALYTFVLFVGASLGPQLATLAGPIGFAGLTAGLAGLLLVAAAVNQPPEPPAA